MATKKKGKKKKVKAVSDPVVPAKERSGRLPGMEDAGIPALEKIAESLADVRSERMKLTKREKTYANDLIALMKKLDKVEYHHEDVHAWRRVTEEKVRVKIGELDDKELEKARPVDVPVAGAAEPPSVIDAAGEIADAEEEEDEFGEYVEDEETEEVGT